MIRKYFIAWFGIVVLAILDGTIRELTYKPYVGDLAAHQISSVVLILLVGFYVWVVARKWRIESARTAWLIGIIWLSMRIVFEFFFGHYVDGQPWSALFHDYNLFAGRVWVFVLIAALIGPYVSYRWTRSRTGIK